MLHTARAAAVDELQVRYDGPDRAHHPGAPLGELPAGGGLHEPHGTGTQRPPGDRVADTRDVPLVRHDPGDLEPRPPGHRTGHVGDLGGGVQRRAPRSDAHPPAEHFQRGVQLQADPHDFATAAARLVDEPELCRVVDHHGHGGGELRIGGELGEPGAVGGGIGEQDVVEPAPRQPQGLGEGEGHDARETVLGQDAFQKGPAAYGLAGDADRLAGGAADEIVRVRVEGVQVHDREGGVEMGGGPVVTGPVGGARSHGRSLPDWITAG